MPSSSRNKNVNRIGTRLKKASTAVPLSTKTVILEGYEVGQIRFPLCKSMLTTSNHFFVLSMFGSDFQEDFTPSHPQGSRCNSPCFLPAFLEDRST